MNKKDCDSIGLILSMSENREDLHERLFELDPRIKEDFEAYERMAGRDIAVDELFDKKMAEKYGTPHWCLLKSTATLESKKVRVELLEEARREIYGDDYHPSLFKRCK
jgi:hypothetical protein